MEVFFVLEGFLEVHSLFVEFNVDAKKKTIYLEQNIISSQLVIKFFGILNKGHNPNH